MYIYTFALAYALAITAVMCGLKIPRGNARNSRDMLRKTSSACEERTQITLLAAIEVSTDAICTVRLHVCPFLWKRKTYGIQYQRRTCVMRNHLHSC
jgi:hypothetical protein